MTRLWTWDSKGPKSVGTPFASKSPANDHESILDYYFGHPTSLDTNSPEGFGRTGSDFQHDLKR